MAELWKEKTGLAFGAQRKEAVRNIHYGHIQDVEIAVFDCAGTFERKIHLLGGELPRRATGVAQTGGKKAVIDMIGLAAEFFQATARHTQVYLFQEYVTVLNHAGFFLQIHLQ